MLSANDAWPGMKLNTAQVESLRPGPGARGLGPEAGARVPGPGARTLGPEPQAPSVLVVGANFGSIRGQFGTNVIPTCG